MISLQESNFREIRDIYIKVLKEGWEIKLERVRENGGYIFRLTRDLPCRTGDLSDFQMGELHYPEEAQIYRVLNPVEEE